MGMKIAGSSRLKTPAVRKTAARDASGQAFSVPGGDSAHATEASAPVAIVNSVASVDALLHVQEVPNESEGRQARNKAWRGYAGCSG